MIVIISILAGILNSAIGVATKNSDIKTAEADIHLIELAAESFKLDNHEVPQLDLMKIIEAGLAEYSERASAVALEYENGMSDEDEVEKQMGALFKDKDEDENDPGGMLNSDYLDIKNERRRGGVETGAFLDPWDNVYVYTSNTSSINAPSADYLVASAGPDGLTRVHEIYLWDDELPGPDAAHPGAHYLKLDENVEEGEEEGGSLYCSFRDTKHNGGICNSRSDHMMENLDETYDTIFESRSYNDYNEDNIVNWE